MSRAHKSMQILPANPMARRPYNNNGLTQAQAAEVITHLAFYIGWPNAFSALPVAKEVFRETSALAGRGLISAQAVRPSPAKPEIGNRSDRLGQRRTHHMRD